MTTPATQYQPTRWSLSALFPAPDSAAVETAIQELETVVAAIEAVRPALSAEIDGQEFAALVQKMERSAELVHRLSSYGQLWFSEDTQNQAALAFMGRMEQILTNAFNRMLFVNLWWKSLDDAAASRLLPYAGDAAYSLEIERLFKDHTLSEPEEKVINIKDVNGINAINTLYDMITNKFVFKLNVDGEAKELTRGELMAYVRHPSADIRAAAYQELYRVYGEQDAVLSQIYIHRVRDWAAENIKLRRIGSPIAVRNLANDIPDTVVNTLLDVCIEQAPVFQRYFRLKADWLEMPKLRRYDLYAPLSKSSAQKVAYADAVDIVLDSLHKFSPVFGQQARRVFDDGHIDAEIRANKRSGAFCASILPGMTPWVLSNFTGEPREVATLAHELGHAIHAMMAAHHSVLTFQSALPLAETASVFAEMLLMDRMLAEETDPLLRRDLLVESIDDSYATVLRQAYFVIFEREAHALIDKGAAMHDLNQLYLANLRQQFGDSLDLSDDFQREWICIPHIYHTPFYCYAYSFGQLLALSLYQRYKNEGDSFKPSLLKILAYGGSANPNHILTEAGIDIANADFWRGGFKFIEGMIAELENSA